VTILRSAKFRDQGNAKGGSRAPGGDMIAKLLDLMVASLFPLTGPSVMGESLKKLFPRAGLPAVVFGLVLFESLSAFPASSPHAHLPRLRLIRFDYPLPGSLFPPEFPPPLFQWLDPHPGVTIWRIQISFAEGKAALHTSTQGKRLKVGTIDRECISPLNRLPELTPQQAALRTWRPDFKLWDTLKRHSTSSPATITISGFASRDSTQALSQGRLQISTSTVPVGAPVFYRDVPLMPSETKTGEIKPIPSGAVHLVKWRLRNIGETSSRVVLENLPVCANCHSFSLDGKTLGMDLDGLQRNKGLYTLSGVRPEMSIEEESVIQWSTQTGPLKKGIRVGFLSQISPDGQTVITSLDPEATLTISPSPAVPNTSPFGQSNYYVANFKDYRFLQVFYPTRGILHWYDKTAGILRPLPGADDSRFVQANAVWSPDGKFLVYARAEAMDPNPPGAIPARSANDPNERQIRYDLYRIPFNNGRGGEPEPVVGASRNGMSNSFPKVSPDGKWIVFVQARNGLLMRPDSQLYLVPAAGGEARRMRCNTPLMNSWHSFSPNGHWLVFASKGRSPYTQLFLTHIDGAGNDSPAIWIENSTASNRAVNLPEFVNVPPDGLQTIGGPVLGFYRWYDQALYWQKKGEYAKAISAWREAIARKPEESLAHSHLGTALLLSGQREEGLLHLQKAKELELRQELQTHGNNSRLNDRLGMILLESGRPAEALPYFQKAIEIQPGMVQGYCHLGQAYLGTRRLDKAFLSLKKALELDAQNASILHQLGIVLYKQEKRKEATEQWEKALKVNPAYADSHNWLATAYYQQGNPKQAFVHWRQSLQSRPDDPEILREMAWVLATSPEASFRNGAEAVALAVKANQLAKGQDPSILDTLAAAYAEKGEFDWAIRTSREALPLAPGNRLLAEEIQQRIRLYESKQPFRDTPKNRTPSSLEDP
jgi:tetratricopeptide (TPR) repeat protein